MRTYFPSQGEIKENWYLLDADGQVLGRLATRVATLLRGKQRREFTAFLDMRDHVIVVNAAKVRLTGNKLDRKVYRHYTGYPGGLSETSARRMWEQKPERMIREAVLGMLPKNKLGKGMARHLLIYAGDNHPHQAQKPQPIDLRKSKS